MASAPPSILQTERADEPTTAETIEGGHRRSVTFWENSGIDAQAGRSTPGKRARLKRSIKVWTLWRRRGQTSRTRGRIDPQPACSMVTALIPRGSPPARLGDGRAAALLLQLLVHGGRSEDGGREMEINDRQGPSRDGEIKSGGGRRGNPKTAPSSRRCREGKAEIRPCSSRQCERVQNRASPSGWGDKQVDGGSIVADPTDARAPLSIKG